MADVSRQHPEPATYHSVCAGAALGSHPGSGSLTSPRTGSLAGGSPPPTETRLPPDGHEFPPDFRLYEQSDGGVTSPGHSPGHTPGDAPQPSGLAKGMLPETKLNPRGRGCQRSESLTLVDSRSREGRESDGGRSSSGKHPSESDLRRVKSGKSGGTSVRDRIALFSSGSTEKLPTSNSRHRLPVFHSLESKVCSRTGQVKDQERSKSDLKLTGNETHRGRSRDDATKRKNISDPSVAAYGSLANMTLQDNHSETDFQLMLRSDTPGSSQSSLVVSHSRDSSLGVSHSRDSSCGRSSEESSEERELCSSPLQERSQSLFDLGRVEKRHSYAGFHSKAYDYHGAPADLPRKTSLNSIMEERKKSFSKLRGLVIPSKIDGFTKKGPPDMPAIKSRDLPILVRSNSRLLSPVTSPRGGCSCPAACSRAVPSTPERPKPRYLASPPWKAESPTLPAYSPAFKRKNVSVYSSPSQGSAFRSVSSYSRLGGSSIELSSPQPDHSSLQRGLHTLLRPQSHVMEVPAREPLQRSSSLNSRPPGGGETRRRVSDDMPSQQANAQEEGDVGSSTLTLVAEPLEVSRSRAGSVEYDHRASTSTLHGSPVKEIDTEEELEAVQESSEMKKEVVTHVQTHARSTSLKASCRRPEDALPEGSDLSKRPERPDNSEMPARVDKLDKIGSSPPKIQEDCAWRKFAATETSPLSLCSGEAHDLSKLRQSTKPSVASLKQKYQHLNDNDDPQPPQLDRSPSINLDRPENFAKREPSTPPELPCAKETVCTSVRDVVDRNWPSIESERADIDRKLSTPSYGAATVRARERRGQRSSRPQSWIESEREMKVFELGGLLSSSSAVSSSFCSQENILDALEATKSPSGSTSSLLEMLTANLKWTARSKHVLSVSDLRRAFERSDGSRSAGCHGRMSSLDSNGSEDGPGAHSSSMVSLTSHKDHYGSITSLASSTSLISPHELQQLIEEANQSLEEAGTPSHEIIVTVIHRELLGGSIGITLAGGADYENKEISVNKVISGSIAERDGRIKKGDRVISINGRSMKGISHREALNILKAPRAEVVLVLSRSRSVTPLDSLLDELSYHRPSVINTFSSRPPKILESPMDSKSLASALAFEDVPRGPPSVVSLLKEGAGVGFSLEGGKDSPLGDRPLVAKKIFTGGAADKSGKLHVGDQILAINDEEVTDMPRIEAWNFLKKQAEGVLRLTIRKRFPPGEMPAPPVANPTLVLPISAGAEEKTAPPSHEGFRPAMAGVTTKLGLA